MQYLNPAFPAWCWAQAGAATPGPPLPPQPSRAHSFPHQEKEADPSDPHLLAPRGHPSLTGHLRPCHHPAIG